MFNFQSENANFLKIRHPALNLLINRPMRLKSGSLNYVSVLVDVFTGMIRGWQLSRLMTQSLTLRPLQHTLRQSVPGIHHSDEGVQYLSSDYVSTLTDYGLRFHWLIEGVLGKTVMRNDLSVLSRRKKST